MSNSSVSDNAPHPTPHWYILGAGAMGCLWAGYLHQAGFAVTLILSSDERRQQLIETGDVSLINGNEQSSYNMPSSLTGDLAPASIGHLLLATKSTQALDAMETVRNALQANCSVLLLQNGMGSQQQVATAFPDSRIYCGVTTEGAHCPRPFTVVHAGHGDTAVGALNSTAALHSLLPALPTQQLRIRQVTDIVEKLWQKLAINCAINGLTAIYRCANGELTNIPELKTRIARLCSEVEAIAKAEGVDLHDSFDRAYQVIHNTAQNRSSMLQDIEHHRPSEMPHINGYICQLGAKHRIACPENRSVRDAVLAIEAAYRA